MAEPGIRQVLGGDGGSILVLGDGVRLAGAGILIGVVAALVLTRLAQRMLYGIEPIDPATSALVAATVLGGAGSASLQPAVRTVRADPMTVLRDE